MTKEMRHVYQETLSELMRKDPNVVMLDADLVSASGGGKNYQNFPNQAINCGISEANMISSACGMSLVGLKPFVHTFVPFATRRVFDQLYMSGAFSKNSIHIFASEPGIYAQFNGGTHTSFEDLALTRTLPNTVVSAPSDEHSFRFILNSFYNDNLMYYTRSPRAHLPEIYNKSTQFEIGKWMVHGDDLSQCIIACGDMVHVALKVKEKMSIEGEVISVIDALNLSPYDKELLESISQKSVKVMVIENHSIYGGLVELVARELQLNGYKGLFYHQGIKHHVSEVGTLDFLARKFGIDFETIYKEWKK